MRPQNRHVRRARYLLYRPEGADTVPQEFMYLPLFFSSGGSIYRHLHRIMQSV